ncbi:MAG: hypothetical protein PWR10_1413 [Halanaerobiales bacterium]|nr:hypothetical protein [Halanaerobiales bacterium]
MHIIPLTDRKSDISYIAIDPTCSSWRDMNQCDCGDLFYVTPCDCYGPGGLPPN